MKNPDKKIKRRNFIKTLWASLGIIAGIEFLAIVMSFLSPSEKRKMAENLNNYKTVGRLADIPVNSVTPFRNGKFYLVRFTDGGIIALSLKCPHLGCSVTWDEEQGIFVCPCHSSTFSLEGNVINSPASRAMDYFPVLIDKGFIKVDIRNPVTRKRFNKSQLTYA